MHWECIGRWLILLLYCLLFQRDGCVGFGEGAKRFIKGTLTIARKCWPARKRRVFWHGRLFPHIQPGQQPADIFERSGQNDVVFENFGGGQQLPGCPPLVVSLRPVQRSLPRLFSAFAIKRRCLCWNQLRQGAPRALQTCLCQTFPPDASFSPAPGKAILFVAKPSLHLNRWVVGSKPVRLGVDFVWTTAPQNAVLEVLEKKKAALLQKQNLTCRVPTEFDMQGSYGVCLTCKIWHAGFLRSLVKHGKKTWSFLRLETFFWCLLVWKKKIMFQT